MKQRWFELFVQSLKDRIEDENVFHNADNAKLCSLYEGLDKNKKNKMWTEIDE